MPRNYRPYDEKENLELVQIQARALSDPTRFKIYQTIADSSAPLSVTEINEVFELNHNAVRQHLAKLQLAGLVVKVDSAPTGLGRPSSKFKLNPESPFAINSNNLYQRLALMLLRIITTGKSAYEVGFEYGYGLDNTENGIESDRLGKIDNEVSNITKSKVVESIFQSIVAQGFAPQLIKNSNIVDFDLQKCPLQNAVDENSRIVCELHKGLIQGLASRLTVDQDSKVTVKSLIPAKSNHPPCKLSLKVS